MQRNFIFYTGVSLYLVMLFAQMQSKQTILAPLSCGPMQETV